MASNVPLTAPRGQLPIRIKGNTKCSVHRTKDVILHCTDCSMLVCLSCSISTHNGHTLVELSDVALQKKGALQDYIHDTENNKLVQLQKEIQSIETKMLENDTNCKELGQQAKKQGEICKQEIDALTEELVSICDRLETQNRDLLLKYKEELQQRQKSLLEQVRECKEVLQSGTDVQVYDSVSELSADDIPEAPVLHEAEFRPSTFLTEQLRKALGMLNTSAEPSFDVVQFKAIGHWSTFQEDFLDEPADLTKFKSPIDCTSICPVTSGAWLCDNESNVLLFVDAKGQTKQRIKYPSSNIMDISISQTGNVWFCCRENFTINEVTAPSFAPVTRFEADTWPTCIFITWEENVVVGTKNASKPEGKLSIYTTEGQMLLSTSGSALQTPHSISQCPVTGNFAVNSRQEEGDGSWSRSILVYDQELEFKWDISVDGEKEETEKSSFYPRGAVYDSKGHILMDSNNVVKVMSGTGQHLRTIIVGNETSAIVTLGVQPDDVLWVHFYTHKLEKRGVLGKLLKKRSDSGVNKSEIKTVKYYQD